MHKSLNWQDLNQHQNHFLAKVQPLGLGVDISKNQLTIGLVGFSKLESSSSSSPSSLNSFSSSNPSSPNSPNPQSLTDPKLQSKPQSKLQESVWEIPNTDQAMAQFLKAVVKSGYLGSIVLEPTNIYHLPLCKLAEMKGLKVVQADPLRVKHFRNFLKGKTKTDKIDALVLAQIAAHRFLEDTTNSNVISDTSQVKPTLRQELRLLTNQLKTLQQNVQRLSSQERHFRELTESGLVDTLSLEPFQRSILELKEQQTLLEKEIERRVLADYDPETLTRLTEIPGLSKRLASLILALLDETKNVKEWFSYAGLDPVREESGTSVNKAKGISKRGHRYLRTLLFQLGFGAGVSKYGFFRDLYDNLKQKGRHHVEAALIVGKKVLRIIHAVLTKKVRFNPDLAKTYAKTT